ncbi:hypothetical protein [Tessaracoccus sp. OH4464_COT-324]|uniref:hypothetical protein n=1 Tax=Tessaracoccus sp. OH4464_COT-324 TaxID=2491059 RepID=UPI000F62D697|nr:hypothetical protein [Tessaracoccus sp. OH4464_COT-324]RRD46611.1 hypothetical protein EII42_06235 [Tessaracoccus sp. OH4464_COT-324]
MPHSYFDDEYDPLAPMLDADQAEDEPAKAKSPTREGLDLDTRQRRADELLSVVEQAAVSGDLTKLGQAINDCRELAFAPPRQEDELTENADGSVDAQGLVRVWFDESNRLQRVRLNSFWYSKIKPGQSLDNAFRQAFADFALRVNPVFDGYFEQEPPVEDFAPAEPNDAVEGLHRITELHERMMAELDAQADATDDADSARETEPVVGRAYGVTITLNPAGLPEDISFDPGWLDRTNVGDICAAVVEAAKNAYDSLQPPEDDRITAYDELSKQRDALLASLSRFIT